jgi:hypothetical protein
MDTVAFDALLIEKTAELLEIYERKTKNKKLTLTDPSNIDYNQKKLLNQINASIENKLKNSKAYKKKCEMEQQNAV